MLLTLCIHHRFLPHFALANGPAIASLEKNISLEVLTEAEEKISLQHRAAGSTGKAGYNQSLLAILRQARGKYVMFADAADQLQADHILKAIRRLEKEADPVVVAGGMKNPDHAFMKILAPQGILMRREEACRFLHAMEYDLVGCWYSLAQLARHGQVLFMPYNLSERGRVRDPSLKRVDVRDLFFDNASAERYIGELCLYDPVTLERYLSDAEKFLLFWPPYAGMSTKERTERMFEKRAALYAMASEQAKSDGNATMHLHFRLRSDMVMQRPKNGKLADFFAQFLRKAHAEESILRMAVAEQLRLEVSLLGEQVMLYMENAPVLKAMQKSLEGLSIQWLDRQALIAKAVSAEEVVVLNNTADMLDRLSHVPQARPGRHFAYEGLRRLLAPQ